MKVINSGVQNSKVYLIVNAFMKKLIQFRLIQEKSHLFFLVMEIYKVIIGHPLFYWIFIMDVKSINSLDSTILDSIKQGYTQNVKQNGFIFQIIVFTFLLISILFLILLNLPAKTQQKYKVMQFLYYTEKIINGSMKLIFSVLAIMIYFSIKQIKIQFLIIIPAIIIGIITFRIIHILEQKNQFQSSDVYVHNWSVQNQIIDNIFCVLTFFATLSFLYQDQIVVKWLLISIWNAMIIFRFKITSVNMFYQYQTVRKINAFSVCLQGVSIITFTILEILNLSILKDNLILVLLSTTAILYFAIVNYNSSVIQNSYFWVVDDNFNVKHNVYLLMNSYCKLIKGYEQNNSQIILIVSSMRKSHQHKCLNLKCYCRISESNIKFLNHYILTKVQKIEKIFVNDSEILLYLINFKLNTFHLYTNVFSALKKIEVTQSQNISFIEKFWIGVIKSQVVNYFDVLHKKINSVNIEKVLQLQQLMKKLNLLLQQSIVCKYQKWNMLSKKICRLNEVRQFSQKQLNNIRQIHQIESDNLKNYKQSFIFNSLLYFYFKKILIRSNDLNYLEKNIKSLNEELKQENIHKNKTVEKSLFYSNSCTLQISINRQNFGQITNANQSVFNMFGFHKQIILFKNIQQFTPQFLRNHYDSQIKLWIQQSNAKTTKISKFTEIFCLHRQNYIFNALRYLKIIINNDKICLIMFFFTNIQKCILIVDNKKHLKGCGKKFKQNFKNVPLQVDIDIIFKDIKTKLRKSFINQYQQASSFIYNQKKIQETILRNKLIKKQEYTIGSQDEQRQQTKNYEDKMCFISFKYKKKNFGQTDYYLIEIIQMQMLTDNYDKTKDMSNETFEMIQQTQTIQKNKIQVKKSDQILGNVQNHQFKSINSHDSQIGVRFSKTISQFYNLFIQPSKIKDRKINAKIFIDILAFIVLIASLVLTLQLNVVSLQDKIVFLKVRANIDRTFKTLQTTINHVYNMNRYKNNLTLQQLAVEQNIWDSQYFIRNVQNQVNQIQQKSLILSSQNMYNYLKTPVLWNFATADDKQIQLLEFFQMTHYVSSILKNQFSLKFQNKTVNYTLNTQMFTILGANVKYLRNVRKSLTKFSVEQIAKGKDLNLLILILTIGIMGLFSGIHFIFMNYYRKSRFNKKQNHLQIYEMIQYRMIIQLKQYYQKYLVYIVNKRQKLEKFILKVQNKVIMEELVFDEQNQTHRSIKLFGRQFYWLGILFFIVFLMINLGNSLISYNMFKFNNEVQFFTQLPNNISQTQSTLLNRLINLKYAYYFNRTSINQQFLNSMLKSLDPNQVMFVNYSTFQSNWIIDLNPILKSQFINILVQNVCEINKKQMTSRQYSVCVSQTIVSKNGLITFTNSFSRLMRNTYLNWKKNLKAILLETDYLANRTQFRQFDYALTFHLMTNQKLNNKIIQMYQQGFNVQYNMCLLIFAGAVLLIVLISMWNAYLIKKDKYQLSMLYGYILLVPSIALQRNKLMWSFMKNNLDFQQKF